MARLGLDARERVREHVGRDLEQRTTSSGQRIS
jgi:hypothetical protein